MAENNAPSTYQYGQAGMGALAGDTSGDDFFGGLGLTGYGAYRQNAQRYGLSDSRREFDRLKASPGLQLMMGSMANAEGLRRFNESENRDRMALRGDIGSFIDRMRGEGEQVRGRYDQYAGDLDQFVDQQLQQQMNFADDYLDELRGYKAEVDQYARGAEQQYDADSQAAISAAVSGQQAAMNQQRQQIEQGIQNGNIRPEEGQEMIRQLNNQQAQQVHTSISQMQDQRDQMRAQLGMQTAGMMGQTSNMMAGAFAEAQRGINQAQQTASFGKQKVLEARIQGEQAQQAYQALELQGMNQMAQALQNLPLVYTDMMTPLVQGLQGYMALGGEAQYVQFGAEGNGASAQFSGLMGGAMGAPALPTLQSGFSALSSPSPQFGPQSFGYNPGSGLTTYSPQTGASQAQAGGGAPGGGGQSAGAPGGGAQSDGVPIHTGFGFINLPRTIFQGGGNP